jgi:replicative DNA helicase
VSKLLSSEELEARLEALNGESSGPAFQFIEPLDQAAESWIDYTTNPEGRFRLGLDEIDIMTRGFGRGELIFVTGKVQSGKTQLVLNAIANNPKSRTLIFTIDEPSELVFTKLAALASGISSEEMEARVKAGDMHYTDLVRHIAPEELPNVFIVDRQLTLGQMLDAKAEAESAWGAPADLVIVDYLELLPGDSVDAQAQGLKKWAKEADVPVLCLHQASRSGSDRGKPGGMDVMRYGGTAEAIMVLEVFRKREDEDLDAHELRRHQDTVTINLCKNKRPPGKIGMVDFHMEEATGRISSLNEPARPPKRSPLPHGSPPIVDRRDWI